ncbi:MAG: FAD-dependent 5-carboxymethylaminomethyl-2-thiouridine(34) oxidoreductase MnmC [Gammaproteobacteria bacterium]|nr:FAD-dependent 5-carboxymethylaminomethyl-2-thiouridine(34) oxidoreductase MnmC [Gammaproteobacteria bacterium]
MQQFSALRSLECLTMHCGELNHHMNFLSIWQLWRDTQPSNTSRLHLIITAQKPLPREELSQKFNQNNYSPEITEQLLAQYPPAISGVHRLIFRDDRLTLDLWFGDVVDDLKTSSITSNVSETPSSFIVIGAGIAGFSMTEALTRRGYAVTLIEQEKPLSGASGNPCALLLSKLPKLNRVSHNLQTMGALTTARWWGNWVNDVVISTGALLKIDEDDLEKIKDYPTDVVRVMNAHEATQHSGITCPTDYMFMPCAVALSPKAIRQHVLSSPLVTLIKASAAQLIRNEHDSTWMVLDPDQKIIAQAHQVIVANAKDSVTLCPTLPPLTVIRGQISWLPMPSTSPQCSIGYGGYTTTFQQQVLLGSSFVRDDINTDLRLNEHEFNLNLFKEEFPQFAENLPPITTWQGRASLRALPRDSMPVVGQVPQMNDVFVLAGLGSKGFSYAPLCAELLAAQILNEALPMTDQLAYTIRPDRFIKKERIRKPYYTPPKI